MNKLLGFYELKRLNLPTINWKEYIKDTILDPKYLWTIRTAVINGEDLNLPRLIGVKADEATIFANQQLEKFRDSGLVIYYPYFVAEKSGTLNIFDDKLVIEAVKFDLWNLVTYSEREVTIQISHNSISYNGNQDFISKNEIDELKRYIPQIRKMFKDYILEGKSILLEWSYAYNCNLEKQIIGQKYLVFYEVRTV